MKRYTKIIAALLAVTVSAGATGMYAAANKDTDSTDDKKTEKKRENIAEDVRATSDEPQSKSETVYVMTDASGKKTKTIVSDWLKNFSGDDTITDVSDLTNITDLRLGGGFNADGSDITWSANGGDVYYKGYSADELPIDIKVTYTLDGKSIAPSEIAGKSGKVTVRYDYVNNEKHTVDINGKKEQMYTPYLMATGVLLDGSKFTNVKVTNGKVISDGDRLVIVGCALPGLSESLGLEDKDVDIPEYFEFTADVNDFEMNTTITSGTSSIFGELELDDIADVDELKSKLDDLTDATDKLCSGTGELCKGVSTLKSGAQDLNNGANALTAGSEQLYNGINTLANGTEQLMTGTQTLDESTEKYVNGVKSAKSGSDAIVSGFNQAMDGVSALKNGADSLSSGLSSANDGAAKVNDGAQSLSNGAQQLSDGAAALSGGVSAVADGAAAVAENTVKLDDGAQTLSEGTKSAKDGAQTLSAGIAQAGAGANAVADGIAKAGAGVDQLALGAAAGAQKIETMTEQIEGAADSLDTTVAYNNQVIEGLKAMLAGYDPQSEEYYNISVMIATLEKTTDGQTKIAEGLRNGAADTGTDMAALTNGITMLQTAFNGDGTQENPGLIAGSAALSTAFSGTEETTGLIDGANALVGGLDTVNNGAEALANGTDALAAGTASLNTGAQQAAQGAQVLSESSTQLSQGAAALAQGTLGLSEGITLANDGAGKLSSGIDALTPGIKKLSDGSGTLNSGLETLVSGGDQLKSGTSTLASSAVTLNNGADQLRNGSGTLLGGLYELRSGTERLVNGVNELESGANELDDGMNKFKEQGIDKILNAYNNDIEPLIKRLEKLTDISREQGSFSGAADGMQTEVRFIYETDAIRVQD